MAIKTKFVSLTLGVSILITATSGSFALSNLNNMNNSSQPQMIKPALKIVEKIVKVIKNKKVVDTGKAYLLASGIDSIVIGVTGVSGGEIPHHVKDKILNIINGKSTYSITSITYNADNSTVTVVYSFYNGAGSSGSSSSGKFNVQYEL